MPKKQREGLGKAWRKFYRYQPLGFFPYGNAKGVWMPHVHEVRACCQAMETPWMVHPYGYQRHCRTLKHVAMLFNVDERDLARKLDLTRSTHSARCANCHRFRPKEDYLCGPCRRSIDSE